MNSRPSTAETAALIEEAARLFNGSETKLARAAGFSQNALWHARRVGRVSGDLAAGIDRATAGRVSMARLRPDLIASVLLNAPNSPYAGSIAGHVSGSSGDPTISNEQSPAPGQAVESAGAVDRSDSSSSDPRSSAPAGAKCSN